nr:hypothetical protein [Tanacetum cinerariifolium]
MSPIDDAKLAETMAKYYPDLVCKYYPDHRSYTSPPPSKPSRLQESMVNLADSMAKLEIASKHLATSTSHLISLTVQTTTEVVTAQNTTTVNVTTTPPHKQPNIIMPLQNNNDQIHTPTSENPMAKLLDVSVSSMGKIQNGVDTQTRVTLTPLTKEMLAIFVAWKYFLSVANDIHQKKVQKKNDVKERSMLLMALPNEHQMTFNQYKDAKTLFAAVQTRFGGNEATKKTQKTLLKQMYKNFNAPSTDTNEVNTAYRVSIANTQVIPANTQVGTTSTQVSTANLSDATVYAFLVSQPNGSQLVHEDLVQIHEDDLEEMHLKVISTPKLDLLYFGLEEFQQPKFEGCGPKTSKSVSEDIFNEVRESPNASLVKELVSDDKLEKKAIFPTVAKIEFVRPKQQEKPVRKPVKERMVSGNNYTRIDYNYSTKKAHPSAHKNMGPRAVLMKTSLRPLNTVRPVNTAHPKTIVYSARPMSRFSKSAKSTVNRPYQIRTALTNKNFSQKVNTDKGKFYTAMTKAVNTARPNSAVVNAVRENQVNVVKALACWVCRPTKLNITPITLKKRNYVDARGRSNGCSRHMTGNMSYLFDFKKFDKGYVTFGGGAKGRKITGKESLKTGKLDFEDVYLVKELQFNLFSVSWMCDKKNNVLFTDTGCFVLSLDFKLADESQILLKVPRKNNMYNVNMKNIVPKESLTCLVAKVTLDESMLWHKGLCHVNFKTINKLVKENLVRATKDETSGILKSFITEIENLVDKKVKIIIYDNETEFKNRVMSEFCKKKGIKKEFSVTRTPQQNGVAEWRNRTLIEATRTMLADSKLPATFWAEAINIACYVQNRVYNIRTRKVEENLHIRFLEDKPIIASDGPNWLFDIDALTKSINYVLVVAGINFNDFVGTEESIGAGHASKETGSTKDYILMQLWKDGSLFDSSLKNASNDEPKPFIDAGQKDDEGVSKESRIDDQERPENRFKDPDYPDKVYKVVKALYGLHQAPRAWYETLAKYLLDNGFHRGKIDQTLFIKKQKGDILLVHVYVDDIIFGSTNNMLFTEFEKLMHDKFQMSSMRELTFFLGLQVKQKEDGIFISQDKYVADILRKYSFTDVKTANTLIDTKMPLLKDSDGHDVDVHLYRFQVTPKVSHLHVVKRIFRTLVNGELELTTTIDGKVTIVTKASVRRHLQLAYSNGPVVQVEVSTHLVESHHTPTSAPSTSQPPVSPTSRRTTRQESVVPQPRSPTQSLVVDEAASTGLDVRYGWATTTVTGLEAEQGSGNIDKTPTMPHDSPLQKVNTLGSDEGGMTQQELMVFYTTLSKKVESLETDLKHTKQIYGAAYTKLIKKVKMLEKTAKSSQARRRERIVVFDNEDDLEDPSKQGRKITKIDQDPVISLIQHDAEIQGSVAVSTAIPTRNIGVSTADDITMAQTLVYIKKSAAKDKGKAKMAESETVQTKTKLQQEQERLGFEAAVRLQAELDEEERQRIARRLQAKEREKYTEAEEARMLAELINKRKRDDLVMLWSLVKEKFNSTEPTYDKEREIWVELKRLFEPDTNDELWKLQKHIHDLTWKLYDSCGVHNVYTEKGIDIYILVEKEYPLSRGTLTLMLVAKLLVDQDNELSKELLRKIFMQAERPRR